MKRCIFILLVLVLLTGGIFTSCKPSEGTAKWYFHQGLELADEGHIDEAIEECNIAIKLDPNMAMAYVNRDGAYNCKGQYNKATGRRRCERKWFSDSQNEGQSGQYQSCDRGNEEGPHAPGIGSPPAEYRTDSH